MVAPTGDVVVVRGLYHVVVTDGGDSDTVTKGGEDAVFPVVLEVPGEAGAVGHVVTHKLPAGM